MLTGSAMVDVLTPIGKGQNMLVIGQDTGVVQRDLVIGAVKSQVMQRVFIRLRVEMRRKGKRSFKRFR
jgi:F0F1-type ATP synthase alpha subunit